MKEIWKDIKGYEGLYQISNLGRVKSLARKYKSRVCKETIKKFSIDVKGYCKVNLCKNGKITYPRIHRLVAEHFILNPKKLPQVNHIDENKQNNRVDNLEWCDNKYNVNYGTHNLRQKITWSINFIKQTYPNEREMINLLEEVKNKIKAL